MSLDVLQPDTYAERQTLPRITWTPESQDLHVNLVALNRNEGIGEHVNQTLDVLLACLSGDGILTVDGDTVSLQPGTVALISAGAKRGVVTGNYGMRYTTCHRKRGGLIPTMTSRPRPNAESSLSGTSAE